MKKTISLILAVILIFSCVSVSAGAVTYVVKPGSKYPTVYVPGRNEDNLVDDVDATNPKNIRGQLSVDVGQFVSVLGPDIYSAAVSDDWTKYCKDLRGLISPMFSDVVLDENGNRKDNSGVQFSFDNLRNTTQTDNTYRIDTYRFEYDWRLDPYENAAILDEYIKAVKDVTGAKKINLLGRCEGSNIVMAYLEQYGNPAEINSLLFAWPSIYGLAGLTSFFTGDISLDADALDMSLQNEATLNDVLKNVVSFLNRISLLDSSSELFNEVYGDIKNQLMPDMVMDTFGTMPSFWAMVTPDRYKEAKSFVFTGREEQYSGLIEKIDYYYEHVTTKIPQILKSYTDRGVKFSVIAKYGYVASSLCTSYRYDQTDGMATVASASLGATSAKYGSTLSYSGKYVSPDKIIDASTCLYPDSTWFVKNLKHSSMPGELENFCARLIACESQPTVSDERWGGQYLNFDRDSMMLKPLSNNENPVKTCSCDCHKSNPGFLWKLKIFFWKLFRVSSHKTCACGVSHY